MERLLVHHVLAYHGQEVEHTVDVDDLHHDHRIPEVEDAEVIVAHIMTEVAVAVVVVVVIIVDHQDVEVIKDVVIQDLVQIHVKIGIDIENDHVHLEVIVNVHYHEIIVEVLLIHHHLQQMVPAAAAAAAIDIVRQKYNKLVVDPVQDIHHLRRVNKKVVVRIANHQVQRITI